MLDQVQVNDKVLSINPYTLQVQFLIFAFQIWNLKNLKLPQWSNETQGQKI